MKLTAAQLNYFFKRIDEVENSGRATDNETEILAAAVELMILGVLTEVNAVGNVSSFVGDGGTEI